MITFVADTHALIWYFFDDSKLSPTAADAMDGTAAAGGQIGVSSMSLVEIVFLLERARVHPAALDHVIASLGGSEFLVEIPVDRDVVSSMRTIDRKQIPEMPDRVIAATALRLGVPLISRDRAIQTSSVPTIW